MCHLFPVNDLELYTFVTSLTSFMYSQTHNRHEFDGDLVHNNTNCNTFTDFVKPDPNISLTVITLTVYMAIFEYQNQVIFNMTVFDDGPSLSH
jgi:hypothetical protein